VLSKDEIAELRSRLAVLEGSKRRRRFYWWIGIIILPAGVWAATAIPNTFTDGDTLSASKLNANFQALAATGDATPTGTIVAFAGSTAPTGWLLCDGSQVSRTTYTALYAVTANAYGSGDGSTSFHLPDLRGRFLRGVDSSAGVDPDKATRTAMNSGGNTGNLVGSVQGDAYKSHSHRALSMSGLNDTNLLQVRWAFVGGGGSLIGPQLYVANSVNGMPYLENTGGNETRPVNAYVNFIIKY
jgi:microcystin-dependent protein